MEKKKTEGKGKKKNLVGTHERVFKGTVTKKFSTRIVVELERTVRIEKYERFSKKKTKLHARLPEEMVSDIHVGDIVLVRECRPLSKIIHFVVTQKVSDDKKEKKK